MIVVVDNLGPVRHAEIDLGKRLIVFAGPNHSGKTHVAWTIYGLLRRLGPGASRSWVTATEFATKLIESDQKSLPIEELVVEFEMAIGTEVRRFGGALATYFVAPLDHYRETTISVRLGGISNWRPGRGYSLGIQRLLSDSFELYHLEEGTDGMVHLEVRSAEEGLVMPDSGGGGEPNGSDLSENRAGLRRFTAVVLRYLGGRSNALDTAATIFPTERTAVNLFARELASARLGLVDRFLQAVDEPEKAAEMMTKSARRYSGPLLDCIQTASDLAVLRRNVTEFVDLADDLETLLGGRIDVTEDGEIGFTLAESGRPRVPFHISASVVKSLASLVFYFRHQAQAGATLVIDEPELNLHPDLQRKVARFLAKAVNAGFRIILSTHSDYVLREFSNLVRLGAAGDRGIEVASGLGYDPESTLKPDVVGVWHFADGAAESLEITGDGFNLQSIEDAIMRQNMDTQEIEMAVGD